METTQLFKDSEVLLFSDIDDNDVEIKHLLDKYKKQIVILPEANYFNNDLYIPEMAINFTSVLINDHIIHEIKYIVSLNNRKFLLYYSCFCGKNTKEFNTNDISCFEKLKLIRDDKNDYLLIIPEIVLTSENFKSAKYIKEYIIKKKWIASIYIKISEILN